MIGLDFAAKILSSFKQITERFLVTLMYICMMHETIEIKPKSK